jgi:Ras-related protein Rab-11A
MMNEEDDSSYEMIFKILIIGDTNVGKSNLLLRYVKNDFSVDMKSTVGVEFGSKILKILGINIKAQIWDTAGQERYRSMTSSYFKGSKGVLIVYDITNQSSFESVDRWINEFRMKSDENSSIIIVGNKNDLEEERKVTKEEGEEKAKKFNLGFFETSAKDGKNVDDAFKCLFEKVVDNYIKKKEKSEKKGELLQSDIDGDNINIDFNNKDINETKKKKCCINF